MADKNDGRDNYTDVRTTYDDAFEKLVSDAFPEEEKKGGFFQGLKSMFGADEKSVLDKGFNEAEELHIHAPFGTQKGLVIEETLGKILKSIQNDPDQTQYQQIVTQLKNSELNNAVGIPSEELVEPVIRNTISLIAQELGTPARKPFLAETVIRLADTPEQEAASYIENIQTGDNKPAGDKIITLITASATVSNIEDTEGLNATLKRVDDNAEVLRSLPKYEEASLILANTPMMDDALAAIQVNPDVNIGEVISTSFQNMDLAQQANILFQFAETDAAQVSAFNQHIAPVITANPEIANTLNELLGASFDASNVNFSLATIQQTARDATAPLKPVLDNPAEAAAFLPMLPLIKDELKAELEAGKPLSRETIMGTMSNLPDEKQFILMGTFAGATPKEIANAAKIYAENPEAAEFVGKAMDVGMAAAARSGGNIAPGSLEFAASIFKDPDSITRLMSMESTRTIAHQALDQYAATGRIDLSDAITPAQGFDIAFDIAGVDQERQDMFQMRYREETPEVRARIDKVFDAVMDGMSGGGIPDIAAIEKNAVAAKPFLDAMTWLGGSSFFRLMKTETAESLTNIIVDHVNNGGTLDQAGMMNMMSGIPLGDAVALAGNMIDAAPEKVAEAQEMLQQAQSVNPALAGVVMEALQVQINEAMAGDGLDLSKADAASIANFKADNDFFENFFKGSEQIIEVLTSPAFKEMLSDPRDLERLIEDVNNINAEAAKPDSEVHPVNLIQLGGLAAREVGYNELGRASVGMSPEMAIMIGSFGGSHLKKLGEMRDMDSVNSVYGMFQMIFGSLMGTSPGSGLSGMQAFLGNMGGQQLSSSLGALMARLGGDPAASGGAADIPAQVLADKVEWLEKRGVDFGKIGRNLAEGTWNADGTVKTKEEPPQHIVGMPDGVKISEEGDNSPARTPAPEEIVSTP